MSDEGTATRVRDSSETWLGDYRLISRIGSGGAGTVYLAHHAPTGQQVALKVLSPSATASAEFVARFQREADIIATLDHPNIVRVFDAGCVDGRCYIAMEYFNYGTLKDRIAAIRAGGDQMPVNEALEIARQIASALDHAHKRGVIHRDVKPGNILLASGGRYVLGDFGTVLVKAATRLTSQSGRLIGTAEYLSPEQANQQPFDHRVDVYALGVVLYEMLAGAVPFSGDNDLLTVYAHAHREPAFDKLVDRRVPREVVAIITRAMHKQPAQRYSTAGEMALAMEQVLSNSTKPAHMPLTQHRRAMCIVVGCIAMLVLIVWLLMTRMPTTSAAQSRARFQFCEVALVITEGVSLRVMGRSHNAHWLLTVPAGDDKPAWVPADAGYLQGALDCVPVVPTALRKEE
jgi:serine/threonine-protein kinase